MNKALLSLLHLTDPNLPIGGFSHSAGLETYTQQGLVKDTASAKEFVVQMLSQNLQYTDAAFVSLVYEAASKNDLQKILFLDAECTAVKLPKEMRIASNKLGIRLMKIFQPLNKSELIDSYAKAIKSQKAVGHYCIAFGLYSQALNIPKPDALSGFYYNAAVGFVTNAVKLVPLSQQSGQEILFSVQDLIAELTQQTLIPDEDLIGLCCSGFDIKSMQHEKLYSRLYMS
ncbi:urease accessory protein UreF [Flavobacterium psychrotolerans]|uniref:Urease accessory protein UreF n=1 Tax=Flavobacterium psychrotolerans TaxID=2169410 RepID=A0A2U1JML8_9FLAO|nr:urease accessory protein UreF [Flavobacterium psychrotolerans]PWA06224.1 urease accessory protein UreF [Flavobacterium psychrotolerans]